MEILSSFFSSVKLNEHQISSFNKFISQDLQKVINDVGNITCKKGDMECIIEFGKIAISKPLYTEIDGKELVLKPHVARLRNITYHTSLYVDIKVITKNEEKVYKKCEIGKIPIMVKSDYCTLYQKLDVKECEYDLGGYFIISGSEKVLICQEKMTNNKIYIFERKTGRTELEVEMRSIGENDTKSTNTIKIMLVKVSEGEYKIVASLPFLKTEIPALIVFKMLKIDWEQLVTEFYSEKAKEVLFYSEQDMRQEIENMTIDEYCSKKMISREKCFDSVLDKYLFPHMKTKIRKAYLYGKMISRLIQCYIGERKQDDRDHFKNKRIDTPGDLLTGLFRQLYKKMHKELSAGVQKSFEQTGTFNIANMLKPKIITNGLKYALATGNWGVGTTIALRTGVSQVLNRHSYLSMLSHMRRINSPIGKDGKLTAPRQLHGSHAFRICPCETPEGHACGLVKNIALTCVISTYYDSAHLIDMLIYNGVIEMEEYNIEYVKMYTNVYVNGYVVGYHENVQELVKILKKMKLTCNLSPYTGIVHDETNKELRIYTDGGRCCRPLFVVENNELIYKKIKTNVWNTLMKNACIEYIDSEEEEMCLIAFDESDIITRNLNFTHCEIHSSMMMGICASTIPYSNHNQAPRNVYQSAMSKQAMGQYATNYNTRMDSYSHVLWYPQKPLVKTITNDLFDFDKMPSGINAIVAIACYGGHNQEDSLIMNQSSIDKGMFRSYFYRLYKDEEKQHGSNSCDIIEKPDNKDCVGLRYGTYDKLDKDGLIEPGTMLNDNDIVIGKTSTISNLVNNSTCKKKDYSTIIRHNEEGIVDSVMKTINESGNIMVKTKVRSMRTPVIGDKFCYTEDHEVLCENGWKPIQEVIEGENVAILDNGNVTYEPVLETQKYPIYNEPLYEVVTQQISLKTTLNHKMYIKKRNSDNYKLIEAQKIMGTRVRFLKNCDGIKNPEIAPIPVPTKNMDAWLYFFGFWIGNGQIESGKCTIRPVKPNTRYLILEAAMDCGLHPVDNGEVIHFYNNMLVPLDTLPEWCFKLSLHHSMKLLKGLVDSDGSEWCYTTSSKQLKDDIQRLVLHAGWSADSSESDDKWQIHINRTKNSPELNNSSQNRQIEQIVHESGLVYCITVRTGIVYVRRHGKTVWCGNSSRHGQKGTIGITLPQEDMPFTADGITPDIIVNPNAIPSRMTIAQLIECIGGKVSCVTGKRKDATAFDHESPDEISEQLLNAGFQKQGAERLYCGLTGEPINSMIFIGPTYYQRLKHMVGDKVHGRSKGPVQILTRQPVEGRSRGGGLRFGEMERDCIISHGSASFLKERLMDQSDAFEMYVCKACGYPSTQDFKRDIVTCNKCKTSQYCTKIVLPYACKLLMQELMSMNIAPKLEVS